MSLFDKNNPRYKQESDAIQKALYGIDEGHLQRTLRILEDSPTRRLLAEYEALDKLKIPTDPLMNRLDDVVKLNRDVEKFQTSYYAGLNNFRDINRHLEQYSQSAQSVEEKLLGRFQQSSYQILMKDIDKYTNLYEKYNPILNIQEKIFGSLNSSIWKNAETFSSLSQFTDLLERYKDVTLTLDPNGAIVVGDELFSPESIAHAFSNLKATDGKFKFDLNGILSWVNETAKEHPILTAIIVYFLIPHIVAIISNLTTPLYEDLWKKLTYSGGPGAKSEVLQDARKHFSDVELSHYRFVTSKELSVRGSCSVRAPAISILEFGKNVRLLKKHKDWSEIEYFDDESDEVRQGCVLSRYLHKFS